MPITSFLNGEWLDYETRVLGCPSNWFALLSGPRAPQRRREGQDRRLPHRALGRAEIPSRHRPEPAAPNASAAIASASASGHPLDEALRPLGFRTIQVCPRDLPARRW
jgi:hypothetical protein